MSKIITDKSVQNIINLAIAEDLGREGDITSELLLDNQKADFFFITREDITVCGVDIVSEVFRKIDKSVKVKTLIKDGAFCKKNSKLIKVTGLAKSILSGERVALNFLQHMSGIATITAEYVKKISGTRAKILDTRKTIPGHRILEKYAVKTGGGVNHRFGLYDGILIKDNHLAICGTVKKALERVRKSKQKVIIECDNLRQVEEALQVGVGRILLDNMQIATIKKAIKIINGKAETEVSGGVNLNNIRKFAETGVDYISVGALTHSARNVDIGLDML